MWALSIAALVMLIVTNTCDAQADEITDVAAMLTADSSVPMAPGVAMELATNLMWAQETSSYAASEPDSLTLSFASVLRAIWLEGTLDGVTEIIDATEAPLPFLQSGIAIDDRVSIEIFVNGVPYVPGEVINFGDVPVASVPDSGSLIIPLTVVLGILIGLRRRYQ
jgi:hypothetical protein